MTRRAPEDGASVAASPSAGSHPDTKKPAADASGKRRTRPPDRIPSARRHDDASAPSSASGAYDNVSPTSAATTGVPSGTRSFSAGSRAKGGGGGHVGGGAARLDRPDQLAGQAGGAGQLRLGEPRLGAQTAHLRGHASM